MVYHTDNETSPEVAEPKVADVLIIGNGFSGKSMVTHLTELRKSLPKEQRGNLNIVTIEKQSEGSAGYAYTRGEGFAGSEHTINLAPQLMEIYRSEAPLVDITLQSNTQFT